MAKKVERAKWGTAGGTITMSDEGLNLNFTPGRPRIYDGLLEQLLDAPKGSVLKCLHVKARYSITKAARRVGCVVAFALADGTLYTKITGMRTEAAVPAVNLGAKACPTNLIPVMRALVNGPMTAKECARVLGVTPIAVKGLLDQVVQREAAEEDCGVYRIKAAKQVA